MYELLSSALTAQTGMASALEAEGLAGTRITFHDLGSLQAILPK
jgi:hypothetical protein